MNLHKKEEFVDVDLFYTKIRNARDSHKNCWLDYTYMGMYKWYSVIF